jgi:hypothetical protein
MSQRPIKLIAFPEIAKIEDLFGRLSKSPAVDDTPPELQDQIDEASKSVFGIIYDDTVMSEPDELNELDDDHPEVVAFYKRDEEYEAVFLSDRTLSYQEQLQYLDDCGFDFRDNNDIRLRVIDHFFRQTVAVGKGLMGRLPDSSEIDAAKWATGFERDAKAFRRRT